MHESHIIQPVIKGILETAAKNGASRITKITVAMSDRSGFSEEAIKTHFALLGEGTLVAGAQVIIHKVPAQENPVELYVEDIEIEQ